MYNPAFDLEVNQKKLKSCFNFANDLQVGTVGEKLVESIFKNNNVKIEVKKDDWAVRSGNIAIEFESRGKASGILVTKADFWCHVIGHFFVLVFPVIFLKQVYADYVKNPKYVKEMGDKDSSGNPVSKAILIPWKELLSMFKTYAANNN